MTQQAVIYCRVSSLKQVTEGHGLASQETRCREYAKHKGYEVVEVFHDEGITGKLLDRPNMKAMLIYLKQHRATRPVVIIDDISRLARDIETHLHLRASISAAGGKLESPSIEFGDDSDSRLVEHLLASVAAHQREKNAEQVFNRMKARMMNGYSVFNAPIGYRYDKVGKHGKLLVPDQPCASVIAEGLEGFASGRFETQIELMRFFEASPHYPKDRFGTVHMQRIKEILSRVLYAGYLDKPDWGIHLVKGHHEALVSYETWKKVQARLNGQAKAPVRKDINEDFPLRGFVTCACCGSPLTACWTRGGGGLYAYYLCYGKTSGVKCSQNGKSIPKDKLEGEFGALLSEMKPSKEMFLLAAEIFTDLWNIKRDTAKQEAETIRRNLLQIERKTEQFLDRIADTDNSILITAYEKKIRQLEEEKIALDEKIAQCGRPLQSFDETFRTAFSFLSNPYQLWVSSRLEHKRAVMKLAFSERLRYCRNEGFRTPEKSLPFLLLEGSDEGKHEMVGLVGLEPTTKGL
ncbi:MULTISPECIES: recombinase family protein [Nitrosomonas]|uniref:Site-specific recombinase n=1 Tax=Nitrosomonas europaea (strain ATCC 19718 / CIP 103999 / KCTC 2705 / NBRC 14298) TaxID=228410 RepID=Q82XM1_NITEU|nr:MULTISPECIES: recombinase family protein [Nitrosomonas]CAD84147.1 Site-specific recombinase [Nitrosomonas europaea ATCC 19718]HBF26020.1 recombinase [Nitrosomonas sp.]